MRRISIGAALALVVALFVAPAFGQVTVDKESLNPLRAYDLSGTGRGPFLPTVVPVDGAGTVLDNANDLALGSRVSFNRTADTNAYTANDVIGAATGSTAALTFTVPRAGEVILTSVTLEIDLTAVTSGMTSFNLYCYDVTPPSALGDNAAFDIPSGDRASLLYKVSLGTPVDEGSTLYVQTDGINKQFTAASTSVFCYPVTVGAYTPASGTTYVITQHFVPF